MANIPLGTTQGSHLGYSDVTVYYGEGGNNGKTYYNYTSPADFADYQTYRFPFAPAESWDWKRGLLRESVEYKKEGSLFVPVKRVFNKYNFYYRQNKKGTFNFSATGVKVGYSTKILNEPGHYPGRDKYYYDYYHLSTGFYELENTTEYLYNQNDPSTAIVSQVSNTYSSNHLQVTQMTKLDSEGREYVTNLKYPLDYGTITATGAAAQGIKLLQDKNIIAVPVESYTIRRNADGTEATVVDGTVTTYQPGVALPSKIYRLETAAPLPVAEYAGSAILNNDLSYDEAYRERVHFEKYEAITFNLQQLTKPGNACVSYVWGYGNTLPIAQVANARWNQVLHTSFEEATTNFSTDSKTGSKSYSAAYSVVLPSAGTYMLTYWKKVSGGVWEHVQELISAGKSIGGTGILIDEVRLYPPDAQMATYTYSPLVGMTSSTDPAGTTVYYEFDGLLRLKRILDQNKHTRESYDYHYRPR